MKEQERQKTSRLGEMTGKRLKEFKSGVGGGLTQVGYLRGKGSRRTSGFTEPVEEKC